MPTYQVHLRQVVSYVVEVEADTAARAERAVKQGAPALAMTGPTPSSLVVMSLRRAGWEVEMIQLVDEQAARYQRDEDERKARLADKRRQARRSDHG